MTRIGILILAVLLALSLLGAGPRRHVAYLPLVRNSYACFEMHPIPRPMPR